MEHGVFSLPRYKVNEIIPGTIRNVSGEPGTEVSAKQDSINWSQSLLQIPKLWGRSTGRGVRVAVLDTGIDLDHPDFRGAIAAYEDFTGEGINDGNGHGTHVAGVIGARRNDFGFVGVAPSCELLVAKVLADSGQGSYDWIVDAIYWAIANEADIISMSLGGSQQNSAMFTAIHAALAEGITIVAAAGNEGSIDTNTVGYPGRYGGVITIASHDQNGNRSGFSSTGGEIDFMAPGSDIYSTYKDGGYASLSGTSMATPFVSGLCALLMGIHQIPNCEAMRNHLMKMAVHPGYFDNKRGYGPLSPFKYFAG